jgi:hypothetical protein
MKKDIIDICCRSISHCLEANHYFFLDKRSFVNDIEDNVRKTKKMAIIYCDNFHQENGTLKEEYDTFFYPKDYKDESISKLINDNNLTSYFASLVIQYAPKIYKLRIYIFVKKEDYAIAQYKLNNVEAFSL